VSSFGLEGEMLRCGVSAGVLCALASVLGGCGSAPAGDEKVTSRTAALAASDGGAPTILTFSSNWTQVASGPLVAGQPVEIAYDPARLVSECGGSATSPGGGGGFAWGITGYCAIGGAAPASFQVTITSAWASGNAVVTPPVAGNLAMWFGCGNTTGQTGWDSDYGQNYAFSVQQAAADAGAEAGSPTGTVVVQVVGDAVQGNAGSVPPDRIVSTPIAGVLVYDGLWEAGNPLGETDANGDFAATLSLGVHQIGVMMITTDESMFSSDGNAVTVTTTPGKLVIHVLADTVAMQATYGAGVGNAIYVTGETSSLGNWTTAYKATYNSAFGGWQFTSHLPAGAQFKLILAPWVDGSSIPVGSAGVQWESGENQVVPAEYFSVLNIAPSF
jgi:hypothetical protein